MSQTRIQQFAKKAGKLSDALGTGRYSSERVTSPAPRSSSNSGSRNVQISILNPEYPKAPAINLQAQELLRETHFMVDTGASVNIIKMQCVHPDTPLDTRDIIALSGITTEKIKTRGSITAYIYGHPIILHVVPNGFPIPQDGILGAEFLKHATCIELTSKYISWQGIDIPFAEKETVIIPARSRAPFYVKIKNPYIKEGYVPQLKACDGIYLGNAVVTNRHGRGYMYAINSTERDQTLCVPDIELQEIERENKPHAQGSTQAHKPNPRLSGNSSKSPKRTIPRRNGSPPKCVAHTTPCPSGNNHKTFEDPTHSIPTSGNVGLSDTTDKPLRSLLCKETEPPNKQKIFKLPTILAIG